MDARTEWDWAGSVGKREIECENREGPSAHLKYI